MDANHCPGAVQFLFRLPDGRRYVHCGDMRFAPSLLDSPHLQGFRCGQAGRPAAPVGGQPQQCPVSATASACASHHTQTLPALPSRHLVRPTAAVLFSCRCLRGCDAVFLDTTYCNPRYCFPAQQESIEYVAGAIQRMLAEDAAGGEEQQQQQQQQQQQEIEQKQGEQQQGQELSQQLQPGPFRRVYLISTYGIGKERILTGGPLDSPAAPHTGLQAMWPCPHGWLPALAPLAPDCLSCCPTGHLLPWICLLHA